MTVQSKWSARLSGAAAAICLIGGGIASAAIPDANGVIHACYTKSTGAIRVIDEAVTTCKPGETPVQWNVSGPMGPQGQPGSQGLQGPQGPAGNTNVLTQSVTVGLGGGSDAKTLDVPGLGTLSLSCIDGAASVSLTVPVAFQVRFGAGNTVEDSPAGETLPLTPREANTPVGEAWVTIGSGVWRVDYVVGNLIRPTPPVTTTIPCLAAVVVTVF